jgi:hypothetical protein
MATEHRQTGNDVVSRLYIAHLGAHGGDDASGFVAEHGRGRTGVEALLEVHVAVTDTSGGGADTDFVGSWRTQVHIFNGQRLMHGAKNGGFHGCILRLRGYP